MIGLQIAPTVSNITDCQPCMDVVLITSSRKEESINRIRVLSSYSTAIGSFLGVVEVRRARCRPDFIQTRPLPPSNLTNRFVSHATSLHCQESVLREREVFFLARNCIGRVTCGEVYTVRLVAHASLDRDNGYIFGYWRYTLTIGPGTVPLRY